MPHERPARRRPALAAMFVFLVAAFGTVWPAAPASAETFVALVGHGWGHGRGMGQYGALGYAVGYGASAGQILDYFYGGTSAAAVGTGVIDVDLRHQVGQETVVYLESGSLVTSVDAAIGGAGPRQAFRVVWQGGTSFAVFEGPGCTGPWTPRQPIVNASEIVIDSSTTSDEPTTMLQLCEPGQRRYLRGEIVASAFGTTADLYQQQTMNRVRVEDYLRSVVPSESPSGWGAPPPTGYGALGMEQLRAQAVAARSYVLAGDGRWGPATTCNDVFCQVYPGYGTTTGSGINKREYATTDQAVADTGGVVRVRTSAPSVIARTEFSSSSGGWTAPSFPPVEDAGDSFSANPYHNWSVTLSSSAIESTFDRVAGTDLGAFQNLAITSRNGFGDFGGRALTVLGVFSGGSQSMSGGRFRDSLGLRSDWFALASPSWQPTVLVRPDGALTSSPQPVMVAGVANRLDVFALGTDQGIWWTSLQRGAWSEWMPLQSPPGGARGQPAGVSWGAGRYDLFVRGADDRLWQRFTVDWGTTWSQWFQPLGPSGLLADAPSVSARGPGRLDVLVTGTDGLVYQRFYDSLEWNSGWIPRGAPPGMTAAGRPTVASWNANRVDVFVTGTDSRLWQTYWDGAAWSPWIMPPGAGGGVLTASPSVVSPASGSLALFGRGTDGGLWVIGYGGGASWSSWQRLGAANDSSVGAPGATTPGIGIFEVIVRGTDNRAYRYRFGT